MLCTHVSLNGTVWMEGNNHRDNFMAIGQAEPQPTVAMSATATSKDTPKLGHRRFGYLGYDNLAKLQDMSLQLQGHGGWHISANCRLQASAAVEAIL